MKTKLTPRLCAELPAPVTGRTYFADSQMPGLNLCATANGARNWYRVGRIAGRPVYLRIGGYPAVSLADARKACGKLNGRIAAGENPADDKRKAKAEPTLAELFAHWLDYAKSHRKSWQEDKRRFDAICKPLAGLKLSQISKTDAQTLHRDIGRVNGQVQANRVLGLLSSVWGHADEVGYLGKNPFRGVKKFAEVERDRFLLPEEVAPFFRALDAQPVIYRDLFTLAILTGARRRNLESMAWVDVRIEDAQWKIPLTKSGQPVIVHLPAKAVEILRRRQADQSGASPWVFAAANRVGHITELKGVWAKIVTAAGLADLRIHDMRRTLGSWQAIGGSSLPIIGKSLGHSSLSATKIYARLNMAPVAESVTRATDAILTAGGVT